MARPTKTLDQVVADNIKALRTADGRRWTATELAEKLSAVTGHEYTRFTVADLEGRREREIRWSELVALALIFDVPLWDLVLPPESALVDMRLPTSGDAGLLTSTGEVVDIETPNSVRINTDRDDMARRLFGLDSETLTSRELRHLWDKRSGQATPDALAVANELLPLLRSMLDQDTSS